MHAYVILNFSESVSYTNFKLPLADTDMHYILSIKHIYEIDQIYLNETTMNPVEHHSNNPSFNVM